MDRYLYILYTVLLDKYIFARLGTFIHSLHIVLIQNTNTPIKGVEGADEEKIRCVCGARPCLGGHAPNFRTRSTMVVSMGSNAGDGKVVDGRMISGMVISDLVASRIGYIVDGKHFPSKGGYVSVNGGMTC